LSEAQAKHLISHKLVERVPEELQASIDPAKPVLTGDDAIQAPAPVEPVNEDDETRAAAELDSAVENCVRELKLLQVPATAGAPRARTALRDAGHRFGNDVIAHAVKRRKQLSDAAPADDDDVVFETVEF
jgi:hypothetical protein